MLVLTFRYDKLQIGSFQTATLLKRFRVTIEKASMASFHLGRIECCRDQALTQCLLATGGRAVPPTEISLVEVELVLIMALSAPRNFGCLCTPAISIRTTKIVSLLIIVDSFSICIYDTNIHAALAIVLVKVGERRLIAGMGVSVRVTVIGHIIATFGGGQVGGAMVGRVVTKLIASLDAITTDVNGCRLDIHPLHLVASLITRTGDRDPSANKLAWILGRVSAIGWVPLNEPGTRAGLLLIISIVVAIRDRITRDASGSVTDLSTVARVLTTATDRGIRMTCGRC